MGGATTWEVAKLIFYFSFLLFSQLFNCEGLDSACLNLGEIGKVHLPVFILNK